MTLSDRPVYGNNALHAPEWADPAIGAELREVWRLLVRGLAARP